MQGFETFPVTKQITFHKLLVDARGKWLVDALRDVVRDIDPSALKEQLVEYVPRDVQQILAGSGIRDEDVFPTPIVLAAQSSLVGYYRLLLGVGQKTFYRSGTGMSPLQKMELSGKINETQRTLLPEFCKSLSTSLANLVRQTSPAITGRDISELSLLTLGAQFQGGSNVRIGQQATREIFAVIGEIVHSYITDRTDRNLVLLNAAGRTVFITLSADPDVSIREQFEGELRNKVAIEIKGGTDVANVHNRAGEAEKSHLKARDENYRDFWTIISKRSVRPERLEAGSPTTTSWFDSAQVLAREGSDWEEFRSRLIESVGIPLVE